MESLGDILRRLPARRNFGSTSGNGADSPNPEQSKEECPICKGRGWVSRRVPFTHPDFGEVFPCRCQEEEAQDRRSFRLHRYSNLGPLSRITFEATDPEGRFRDPESRRLFKTALQAARTFAEDPKGWLVFTGPSGCGKTHVAAAIASRCIEHGQTVFFMFVPDLLDHLRGTYSPESAVSYDELFQQVREAPVLVLDDLGSHSGTPWAQEKLSQVFNHRFNALLPTVITVRGPLQRLEESMRTRMEMEGSSAVYCLGGRDVELLREVGGLQEDMLKQMTFQNFKLGQEVKATERQRDSLKFALDRARSFAETPSGWLLFTGLRGCGKTHLAVGIINERLKRGQPAFFAFVPALLDHLRATFRPDSLIGYDELFEQVKTSPLLVLDDLASENSTPWAEEKLYQIIVHRHNARLPTVITTNLESVKQLEEAKPRIQSRLSDALVEWAPIRAPDYRDQRHLWRSTPKSSQPPR